MRTKGQGTGVRSQESGAASGAGTACSSRRATGMQRLVDAIAARLPAGCVRLNSPVERIERRRLDHSRQWARVSAEQFDDLILAAPGAVSSRLLENVDAELATLIGRIPHAGCSVAVLGVPPRPDRASARRLWLRRAGDREPPDHRLQHGQREIPRPRAGRQSAAARLCRRCASAGAGELPDDEIRKLVLQELGELIGLSGEPEFCDVARWQGMMPQYHVGHLDLVGRSKSGPRPFRISPSPATPIAAWAFPFASTAAKQAAERSLP